MKIKIPSFVSAYATYKKKEIASSSLMLDTYKAEKAEKINRAVDLAERGFITIDETMQIITEV